MGVVSDFEKNSVEDRARIWDAKISNNLSKDPKDISISEVEELSPNRSENTQENEELLVPENEALKKTEEH